MDKTQKRTYSILFLIGFAYLIIMGFPNFAASEDQAMVWVFQPDEGSPLPYVLHMIEEYPTLKEAIFRFINYNYYGYGYPYFAYSALLLFPLRYINQISNIPLIMLILRHGGSILPMLVSIGFWVYMHTKFKQTAKSTLLFLFLLTLPAVTANNFWWHPDSLTFLFVTLTTFFLYRDQFDFGKYFYLAALACGLATGTKLIGLYFFLTIAVYLLIGLLKKQITWKTGIAKALFFLAIMFGSIILSNPAALISAHAREGYMMNFEWYSNVVDEGYEIRYPNGPASWNVMFEYYGNSLFLLIGLASAVVGVTRKTNRLLYIIILTWFIPAGIYSLGFVALKFQYLLPLLIPLLSSTEILIPPYQPNKNRSIRILMIGGGIIMAIWFSLNMAWNIPFYTSYLNRADNASALSFFNVVKTNILDEIPEERELFIYHDPRMYVPTSSRWYTELTFEMLDQQYFEDRNPHIIMIRQQRIYDYTSEYAQNNALAPELYQQKYDFYTYADGGIIEGYQLLQRDDYGLVFVRQDVYDSYFVQTP